MASLAASADPPARAELTAVAERLSDIAQSITAEAEGAVARIRDLATHAHGIEALAADLRTHAATMEAAIAAQSDAIAEARDAIAAGEPAIEALARSIESVGAISKLIAGVARQSQLLSLNARIEAARVSAGSGGFAVVAQEMSALSTKTRSASDEIGTRTRAVAAEIEAASRVALSGSALVASQSRFLDDALASAAHQRATALTMAQITTESAGRIDEAATNIGRVASSAVAARLLARQIARMARD